MSLSFYNYKAYTRDGQLETGQLSAESEQEVINTLKTRQLSPVKIEQTLQTKQHSQVGEKLKNNELIEFTQGLSTLILAKIPIDKALLLLSGLTDNKSTKQLVESLRRDVKEGKTLAQAMEKKSASFSKMYISMVRAGEEGGILEQLLPSLEKFLSESQETKREIIGALIYPAVLLFVGILSIVLMLGFVVPQFATLFEDAGSKIPDSAALLLSMSAFVNSYGWLFLVFPFVVIALWKQWGKDPSGERSRDLFLLNLPLLGQILLLKEASAFCKTLGSLLNAGIPLFKSLRITRGVIANHVLLEQLSLVEEEVTAGMSLGNALAKHTVFPTLLPRLVSVGEETGATARMLQQLAVNFDKSVKNSLAKMVSLAEPVLILVLGILVGGIVVTMLSAVFSLNDMGM